jgi:hypothetical protein
MAKKSSKETPWTPQPRKKRRHQPAGLRHRKKLGPKSNLR